MLIWLTSLPKLAKMPAAAVSQAEGQRNYQGLIYNVVVRGSAASAAA